MKLEIRKLGNSTGLILPKELVTRLGLAQGDVVHVTETPDGFAVHRDDAEFERGMELARQCMKQYHNALTELAK
jgi:putative addiction module antidote